MNGVLHRTADRRAAAGRGRTGPLGSPGRGVVPARCVVLPCRGCASLHAGRSLGCVFVCSFCSFAFARLRACLFVPGCFWVRSLGLGAVGLLARLLAGCVSRVSVARKLGSFVGPIARMVWSHCAWTTVASAPGRDDIRVERPRLLLRRELPALRSAERFATQRRSDAATRPNDETGAVQPRDSARLRRCYSS